MGEKGYKDILTELERGVLANPLIFYGEEEYLFKWALDLIVGRYMEPSLASLNLEEVDWNYVENVADLTGLWKTLPMMADKRVMIIDNFTPDSQDPRTESLMKELLDLPSHCVLILSNPTVDKRTKLYKKVFSAGGVYNFARLSEGELRSFIVKRFKQAGKNAHNAVIRTMVEESGYLDKHSNYSLYNMENDIKKLIALSENDLITSDQVKLGLTKNTEAFIFDMIDAISLGKKGEAIHLLHGLLKGGDVWQRLLPLIISTYELMLVSKEMLEEGHTQKNIIEVTGAHEYRVKKAQALARKYSVAQLRKNLSLCLNVDREIKSGLMDSNLALELLIANI